MKRQTRQLRPRAKQVAEIQGLGEGFIHALKRIANFAKAGQVKNTRGAIKDASRWSIDYASELALYELELLEYCFENGAEPEELKEYIAMRRSVHREAKTIRYWNENNSRRNNAQVRRDKKKEAQQ